MSEFNPKHVCDYTAPTPNVCIGCAYERGVKDGYNNGYTAGAKEAHDVATNKVANMVEAYYRDGGDPNSVPYP